MLIRQRPRIAQESRRTSVSTTPAVTTDPVNPPDLPLGATLRRLYPLWWEQRRLVLLGLACALVFTGTSLTIPILIQHTIDNAIDGGDTSLLVPYLAAILVVAAIQFSFNFTRRFATARVGIAVEARLRSLLY